MSLVPEPTEQLKDTHLRFLESEQFQEMLDPYKKLKPLEKDHPQKVQKPNEHLRLRRHLPPDGQLSPNPRSVHAEGAGGCRDGLRYTGDRHLCRCITGYFR